MAGNAPFPTLKTLEEQVRLFGPVSLCPKPSLALKTALGDATQAFVEHERITAQTRLRDLSEALKTDYKNHSFHWLMDGRVVNGNTVLANLSLHDQRHPLRGNESQRLNHELSLLSSWIDKAATYSDIDEVIALVKRLLKKTDSQEAISSITDAISKANFWNEKLTRWQQADLQALVSERKCELKPSTGSPDE